MIGYQEVGSPAEAVGHSGGYLVVYERDAGLNRVVDKTERGGDTQIIILLYERLRLSDNAGSFCRTRRSLPK